MPLLPLKLPSGFYRNGTDYEQSNRWRDGSLVRWRDGSLRPVGGWRDRKIGQTEYGPQIVANDHFISKAVWDTQAGWSIASDQCSYDQLVNTFDAGDSASVDYTTDTITIIGHNFDNGDAVEYGVPALPAYAIGGLTDGVTYYVVNKTIDTFQLAATSGGTAITLTAPLSLTFDADDLSVLDLVNDQIIAANTFADGDQVTYTAGAGGQDIGGLTNNSQYFIVSSTATEFSLSATSGGAAIDLTASVNVTFDGDDATVVDIVNDKIVTANTFTDGDELIYTAGTGVQIDGLTDGATYFALNASASEFQLAATSGGTAIAFSANYELTIDATDVAVADIANDKFVVANTFTSGDKITYSAGGGTAIAGLTDGGEYFVINASPTQFQLATTRLGTAIDMTAQGVGAAHSIRLDIGSDHNVRSSIGGTHNLERDIQVGHTMTCTSAKPLVQTIPLSEIVADHKYHLEVDIDSNVGGGFYIKSNYFNDLFVEGNNAATQYVNFRTPTTVTDLVLEIEPANVGCDITLNSVRARKVNAPRAIHTWESLDNSAWITTGSYSNLYALTAGNVNYDITPYGLTEGLEDAELGSGYGSGFYGLGGYGQPRQNLGVYSEATTWSLDNFGEVLVACSYDDGKLYDWALDVVDGSDIITNGTFATDSDWTKAANWSISGGAAQHTKDQGDGTISQNVTTDDESVYQLDLRLLPDDVETDPRATVKITGVNTSTVLLDDTIGVGDHSFRVDIDDTSVTVSVEPVATSTDTFTVDNLVMKKKPVAQVIANAPVDNLGLVVTGERFLVCLGASGNPRKVQWADRESRTDWTPSSTNEAGDIELQTTGQIMQAIRTRGATLIITDVDAHSMRYLGPPYVFGFDRVGTSCGTISRKAAVDVDLGVFWMGQGGFYKFDSNSVSEIPCEVRDYVFDDFNTGQQSKIFAYANSEFSEVWWYYPSSGSEEIDRYVAYNYRENFWMIGEMERTCGASRGVFRYPILGDTFGTLHDHEVGVNKDGAYVYAETGPISLGNGDQTAQVMQIIPDEATQGQTAMFFKTRYHPNDVEREYGPFTPSNPTSARFQGRQIRMKIVEDQLTPWRVGIMRLDVVPRGRR
jgi:hypothetical protein